MRNPRHIGTLRKLISSQIFMVEKQNNYRHQMAGERADRRLTPPGPIGGVVPHQKKFEFRFRTFNGGAMRP
jgi:hypothetical protein